MIFQILCSGYYFGLSSCHFYIQCSHWFYSLTFPFKLEENFGIFVIKVYGLVYIKLIFQVIFFATWGSLKDA